MLEFVVELNKFDIALFTSTKPVAMILQEEIRTQQKQYHKCIY
jgi:hypothetical protein